MRADRTETKHMEREAREPVSPKFSVIRTVVVAAVSTLLVVGLGVALTLAGAGFPGIADLEDQRAAGAAILPTESLSESVADDSSASTTNDDAPAGDAGTAEPELTPAEQAMNDLVEQVEEQADVQIEAELADPGSATSAPEAPAATAPRARAETTTNEELPPATPYSFQLSSFNILGSNHTRPGGSARGYAPGRIRAEWAGRLILDRGVDIVGWSEIQPDQHAAMLRTTGGAFESWPGTTYGYKGTPASLMWRSGDFEAVWKGTVTIPFVGQQRPMPVVQLRHRATGREFFVMNVHNAPQDREWERNIAEERELSVVRSLRKESGLPVLLVGDFNEKAEIFCTVTGTTDLYAAAGGSNGGTCRPPGGMRVDWIFGSNDVDFSGYVADQGSSVRRITDHAALFATVTVP